MISRGWRPSRTRAMDARLRRLEERRSQEHADRVIRELADRTGVSEATAAGALLDVLDEFAQFEARFGRPVSAVAPAEWASSRFRATWAETMGAPWNEEMEAEALRAWELRRSGRTEAEGVERLLDEWQNESRKL